MMQSSKSLFLLVLLGCSLAVQAKLTPFFDYSNTEQRPLDLRSRSRQRKLGSTTGRYGQKVYEQVDCESFYGKSHKKSDSTNAPKKLYKTGKKCKGNIKGNLEGRLEHDNAAPSAEDNYKELIRFIMVAEESGTPSPGNFGVGDSLAINGRIYYWADYEDDLMSDIPVGSFVTLCTGISFGGDLMCTYEIVLGKMTHKNKNGNPEPGMAASVNGIGAFIANGPNAIGENQMIVTGTEFGFSEYKGGTIITTEDLINPYLYADLYLL